MIFFCAMTIENIAKCCCKFSKVSSVVILNSKFSSSMTFENFNLRDDICTMTSEEKFSKVSAVVILNCKFSSDVTFENFNLLLLSVPQPSFCQWKCIVFCWVPRSPFALLVLLCLLPVLQCVAVCCSVLQCIAVCCVVCVVVCYRKCAESFVGCLVVHLPWTCCYVCCLCCSVLQCVAVCCSVLRCVCCSALRCVCCSVLQKMRWVLC